MRSPDRRATTRSSPWRCAKPPRWLSQSTQPASRAAQWCKAATEVDAAPWSDRCRARRRELRHLWHHCNPGVVFWSKGYTHGLRAGAAPGLRSSRPFSCGLYHPGLQCGGLPGAKGGASSLHADTPSSLAALRDGGPRGPRDQTRAPTCERGRSPCGPRLQRVGVANENGRDRPRPALRRSRRLVRGYARVEIPRPQTLQQLHDLVLVPFSERRVLQSSRRQPL